MKGFPEARQPKRTKRLGRPRAPFGIGTGYRVRIGWTERIARLAAECIKRTHLELGGKDAFVIAPDADIETAVEAVAHASLINAGQVCASTERVYVPNHQAKAFTEAIAAYHLAA